MPKRHLILGNGEYYHVYNRSVGKEQIFVSKRDVDRVFHLIEYYRFPAMLSYSKYVALGNEAFEDYTKRHFSQKPLVEIHAFCLMQNHYHFVLKQNRSNGILLFLSDLQIGFAKYFNTSHERHGTLFGGRFQAAYIEDENTFFHVIRYVELNPVTSFLINMEELRTYSSSSYMYRYASQGGVNFLENRLVKDRFGSEKEYENFIFDQAEYQQNLRWIKKAIKE